MATGEWCPEYNKSPRITVPGKITAQQHYDLLYNVFARDTGVKMRDFALHVFISDDTLQNNYSKARQADISQHHSSYTIQHRCGGKSAGKATQHEADTHINAQIIRFCESTSRPGDVIVIITAGDSDHVATVRKAVQEFGVHVCQLYTDGTGKSHSTWLSGDGYGLVSWAESWPVFLRYHQKRKNYNMRPSAKEEAQRIGNILQSSLKYEDSLGQIGIVLLLDITDSMQPAIDDVKAKLEAQLLVELQERYPSMRGKFHFAVVGYRDVKSSTQFKVHDFDSDAARVAEFLQSLRATSGHDHPEDIAGALLKVCTLEGWNKTSSNILFHIFDAPGHGKRFNDVFYEGSPYYSKYGGDDFWDYPPQDREDPSTEIERAMDMLKNKLNVVKYYAVTVRSANYVSLPVSPTAKTVAALKEIGRHVPLHRVVQHDILSHSNTDNWVEEVDIGINAARLVNTMVGAASRTLGATASASRTLASLGNRQMVELNRSCAPIHEGYEGMQLDDVCGSTVTLPRAAGRGGPASASTGPTIAVAPVPSTAFQRWAQSDDGKGFMQEVEKRFQAITNRQECEVSLLEPPEDLTELCYLVDGRGSLGQRNLAFPTRKFKVLEEPFAEGAERSAYLALNDTLGDPNRFKLHVLKELRLVGPHMLSVNRLKLLHTTQTVAGFLAEEFNRSVEAVCPNELKLKYLEVSLLRYHVYDQKSRRSPRNSFMEEFVLGKLVKYNDNGGGVASQADFLSVCDAFPHWSYHATEGRLMVTDIQGWLDKDAREVRLTDPCIHCQALGLLDDANKDRWLQGMEDFFKSHTCGETCKALKLDVESPPLEQIAKLRARITAALLAKDDGSESTASSSGDTAASNDAQPGPIAVDDYIGFLRREVRERELRIAMAADAPEAGGQAAAGGKKTTGTATPNPQSPSSPPSSDDESWDDDSSSSSDGGGGGRGWKICRFFARGYCANGADCDFKHFRDRPCPRLEKDGHCQYGRKCWYRHS
ncbi:hypothetical protein PLESTM_001387400 [Pleodorina starrii]|nr:hypothetical protein PLESTM_001387400 [Pleodorina starrii]